MIPSVQQLDIPLRRGLPDWVGIGVVFLIILPVTMLNGTYTGSMLVEHRAGYIEKDRADKTPDFWEMNLKVSYDFTVYKDIILQVNAGVQNLFNAYQKDFDQGKLRDSGYIYGPGLPRSYFAGVKLSY